jgi:8-oxo-dGTP pyrophosphatase MutT (NUDIX family)
LPHPFRNPFDADHFELRLRRLAAREPFVFPKAEVPADFRRSSVLICFWREAADLRVILTKRAATLSWQPGQMSFPGGKLDPEEAWADAAIRETEEEVGISRQNIEVLGRLDDAWSGAGHLLVPIVGWLDEAPRFAPNPAEVAEVHTPSVKGLMQRSAYSREDVKAGERTYRNQILEWEGGRVYGLSTDLLVEALEWASGIELQHGRERLDRLRSHQRLKEKAARGS